MAINAVLWLAYAVLVGAALVFGWQDDTLSFAGPLGGIKLAVWVLWLSFLGYSVYCSTQESLFRTMGKMAGLHWGRQIGLDLYLGVSLALIIIYLHEGSLAVVLWLVPAVVYANLAILLYFAIHFDALVARFIA